MFWIFFFFFFFNTPICIFYFLLFSLGYFLWIKKALSYQVFFLGFIFLIYKVKALIIGTPNFGYKREGDMVFSLDSRKAVGGPEMATGEKDIVRIFSISILRVQIDDRLQWADHVNAPCAKLSSTVFLSRSFFRVFDGHTQS